MGQQPQPQRLPMSRRSLGMLNVTTAARPLTVTIFPMQWSATTVQTRRSAVDATKLCTGRKSARSTGECLTFHYKKQTRSAAQLCVAIATATSTFLKMHFSAKSAAAAQHIADSVTVYFMHPRDPGASTSATLHPA